MGPLVPLGWGAGPGGTPRLGTVGAPSLSFTESNTQHGVRLRRSLASRRKTSGQGCGTLQDLGFPGALELPFHGHCRLGQALSGAASVTRVSVEAERPAPASSRPGRTDPVMAGGLRVLETRATFRVGLWMTPCGSEPRVLADHVRGAAHSCETPFLHLRNGITGPAVGLEGHGEGCRVTGTGCPSLSQVREGLCCSVLQPSPRQDAGSLRTESSRS